MGNSGISVIVVLLSCLFANCTISSFYCAPTQFLEYEVTGVITCKSEIPFFGIYWYNSNDSTNNPPFLYRDDSSRGNENTYSVKGYEISETGSLVIQNVSLEDEHQYRAVLIYDEASGQIETRDINVKVIAKPASRFPVIDICSSERFCFSTLGKNSSAKCSVEDARPEVSLQWSVITAWNETVLFSEPIITKGTKWLTSSTQITLTSLTRLALLACKAVINPPGMFQINDSFILMENQAKEVPLSKRRSLQVELGFPINLKCPSKRKHVLKWEKIYDNGTQITLGFAFLSKEPLSQALYGYQIDENGNLILPRSHIEHEGLYRCFYGDGRNDGGVEINVLTFGNPEPPLPVVHGCEKYTLEYCVLRVQSKGILTCSLHRIRPVVRLEIGLFKETHNDPLAFNDQVVVTANADGTFDITLTSGYHLLSDSQRQLTVQCRALGTNANLTTTFDLHFQNEEEIIVTSSIDKADSKRTFPFFWLYLLFGLFIAFALVVITYLFSKKKKSAFAHGEQNIPILQSSHVETDKTAIFIKELKKKYERLYNAILPVPFLLNDKYCVNRVFVESAVELKIPHTHSEWKRLKSYKEVVELIDSDPKRMLVVGEPGIGKSTLSLQLAYDWCNQEKSSNMTTVKILILLRLRQLRGTNSIYDSIKLLLLPIDTALATQDIENILKECNSVLVVLDGFDECGDQKVTALRDIENVIKADMFQDFNVLICTRPSCLPKELPPKTHEIRMKGFDGNAQEQYIAKTITSNIGSVKYVKDKLKENIILLDFCEIPLFFVMYVHLTYRNDITVNFNSVTSFFRYIISCCYSHFENKATIESCPLSKEFKENYEPISQIAFNGILGELQNIVWDRKELETLLGIDSYKKYTQIGILVEEEVLEVINEPGISSARHISYKTEVRFYHKLFCEWYAAHHVSDLAESASEGEFLSVLHKVFDTNQEYIFRFACGINPKCAEKIIKYLTERREEDRLAILCLLEKTGSIENIRKEISSMCQKQISISANDPRIVQRSSTQLLEMASKNKIVISNICLRRCFKNVNLENEHIVLTSGIILPKLGTVCEFEVFAEEREFDVEEINDILRYCILCGSISILRLKYCLLPEYIRVEKTLMKNNTPAICVSWAPNLFRSYTLDSKSGHWKNTYGRYLDGTGYQEEVASFRATKS